MTISDPISDMLTRIRNANIAKHDKVNVNYSKLNIEITKILLKEGYIDNYKIVKNNNFNTIDIKLKYFNSKKDRVIVGLKRISKPGLRIYSNSKDIPKVIGGFGISIISTPKGIMTGKEAKKMNVGGELLAYIW